MNGAIGSYHQTLVETASPAKLVLMLYDGLIKNINNAQNHIQNKKIEETHICLTKAQAIVGQLAGSLNMDAGELAVSLLELYKFYDRKLVSANINKDEQELIPVLQSAITLRDAWHKGVVSGA